jgi:hypothetical protein
MSWEARLQFFADNEAQAVAIRRLQTLKSDPEDVQ